MSEKFVFSNVLFTAHGFKSEQHRHESVNEVFFAGFNKDSALRKEMPDFDLTRWDKARFTTPQIGTIKIFGHDLNRVQHVVVKIIYNRPSHLDDDSFDAIPTLFLYFERTLPADISANIKPETIIIGAEWELVKVRTYASPTDLTKVITYDFSE